MTLSNKNTPYPSQTIHRMQKTKREMHTKDSKYSMHVFCEVSSSDVLETGLHLHKGKDECSAMDGIILCQPHYTLLHMFTD
jgi:hypothetical protein